MADYWKSNPKHFCKLCKCWMGDNKMSIRLHEEGLRHKASVQRKMNEAVARGRELAKEEKTTKENLDKMNAGAIASMMKDIKENPSLAAAYGLKLSEDLVNDLQKSKASTLEKGNPACGCVPKPALIQSSWERIKMADGRSYYYNTVTAQTSWTNPDVGKTDVQIEKSQLEAFYQRKLHEISERNDVINRTVESYQKERVADELPQTNDKKPVGTIISVDPATITPSTYDNPQTESASKNVTENILKWQPVSVVVKPPSSQELEMPTEQECDYDDLTEDLVLKEKKAPVATKRYSDSPLQFKKGKRPAVGIRTKSAKYDD